MKVRAWVSMSIDVIVEVDEKFKKLDGYHSITDIEEDELKDELAGIIEHEAERTAKKCSCFDDIEINWAEDEDGGYLIEN